MTLDRLTVLCVGNLLMHDEGLGPRVASELLSSYQLPDNVLVLDRGVMGMAILADLRAADKVLIVDALDHTGFAPGTVLSFTPDQMASYSGLKGAHDLRLTDVLAAAALVGIDPKVDCLGVQVKEINSLEAHIGLSLPLEDAIPAVLVAIEGWLADQGSPIIRL
ncbi:MAG: hydrogenase maturation protease [Coriobacteriia bacterium]|nr:hydrogenase maturation protease [Coriobacteriia bacterium]